MIKLGIAMGSATLVAMLILIGGSLSDVRMWAVLTRCMTGFFVVGAVVYLVTFLLEYFNIIGFDKVVDDASEVSDENDTQDGEQKTGDNQDGVGDDSSRFTPLIDSILDRVHR